MIASYVDHDHAFCLLYKKMRFHHLYACLQPTLEQQCDSWDNYCNLFQVWNVVGVLNYLQALIEKSMILQILDEEKNVNFTFTATDGYDYYGGTNVLKVLGYFSIAGLLHVHCLFVDYQSGLCALSPVDINHAGVFNTVIGCQVTTIHYYGFVNLMLQRYLDSIRSFNQLLYIFKTKQCHQRSSQYD
ncbi:unnamed protein product [Sphagnum troendelagicum]|uniref:Uncharacterized protein n=1 Tax=Sphagnum jensenii TaxID=128206 RepID=A0ABP0WXP3_9BRYO